MSLNANEQKNEDENYYYYYYYYDDSEANKETKIPLVTRSNTPSSSPSSSEEYYYYYYEENDTSHPPQTPSEEEVYYYYYEENDTSHPSQTPSEEEVYYYYYEEENEVISQPPQVSSEPPPSLPTEDEEIFYYYYVEEDSTHPSISPPITNNEGRVNDMKKPSNLPASTNDSSSIKYVEIGNGRGCHDFIMSSSSEGITTNELSFTFMAETSDDFQTWDDVARKIIEESSPSILRCTSEKMIEHGIFLIHFPKKEPFVQENRCIPVINDINDCFVFSGSMILASNRMITEKESDHAYLAIQGAINSLDTLHEDIAFAKYLGPTTLLENNSHVLFDQIIVAITVVLSIPLIFLVYRYQRKLSKGYKRVTFANQTDET